MFELDAPCRSIFSVRTWAAGVAHPMEVGCFLCADGEVDYAWMHAYAHVSESAASLLQRTTSSLRLYRSAWRVKKTWISIAPPMMESTTATTSCLLARLKKEKKTVTPQLPLPRRVAASLTGVGRKRPETRQMGN